MKNAARLAVVPAILWIAAPSWAQPSPDPGIQKVALTAEPLELRAGEQVNVAGFGCAPGNRVRFDLYDPTLSSSAEVVAEANGSFVQTIQIPPAAKVGRTWLQATCLTPESTTRIMEAVLLIGRPEFAITGINIFLGIGTTLVVFGLGLLTLGNTTKRTS